MTHGHTAAGRLDKGSAGGATGRTPPGVARVIKRYSAYSAYSVKSRQADHESIGCFGGTDSTALLILILGVAELAQLPPKKQFAQHLKVVVSFRREHFRPGA